jgi:hypothetical protein
MSKLRVADLSDYLLAAICATGVKGFLDVGYGIIVCMDGKKYIIGKVDEETVNIYDRVPDFLEPGNPINLEGLI